jgi:N-acetylneuraminic acid mutarotase
MFWRAVNGEIYVIGGRVSNPHHRCSNVDIVEEYDPATNAWARRRNTHERSGGGWATYNGKIMLRAAKRNRSHAGRVSCAEAYDPSTNT